MVSITLLLSFVYFSKIGTENKSAAEKKKQLGEK